MKSKTCFIISHLLLLFGVCAVMQVQAADLQVEVSRIQHLGKPVYIRVYQVPCEIADQKVWPDEAMFEMKYIPVENTTTLEFGPVDTGYYFISMYQDLNNNQMLDKTRKGIPKEPYALSNNPILFRTPKLSKLMFEVSAESTVINIFMRERKN